MGKPKDSLQHGGQRCYCYWNCMGPKQGSHCRAVPKRVRVSEKKGKLGVKVKLARDVIREVCGFTPYERRAMEWLSQGFDKRALKFCKKRLGTPRRGKKKRLELEGVLQAQKLKK